MSQNPQKKKRRYRYVLLAFVSFIFLSIVLFYCLENKTEIVVIPEKERTIILELVLKEVVTTPDTKFFSLQNKDPLLWFTRYKDEIVFFNKKGKHPISGDELLPVTNEVISEYKLKKKQDSTALYRVNVKGDIIASRYKKKVKLKKRIKRNPIWNTSLINKEERSETSLFIFNNNKIDSYLTDKFKEEFQKKKYYITPEVIYYSELNKDIIQNIKTRKIDSLKGNFKNHTDYICTATASYSYSKNVLRKDMLDCKMKIEYAIYDVISKEIMLSESDEVTGTGITKKEARKITVNKFAL
jgi:hypothetical protein